MRLLLCLLLLVPFSQARDCARRLRTQPQAPTTCGCSIVNGQEFCTPCAPPEAD